MGEMKIKPMHPADAPQIFEILSEIYQQPLFPMGGYWSRPLLDEELKNGEGFMLWQDKILMAFILYRRMGAILDIVVLGTSHSFRRQGLMERLLLHMRKQQKPGEEIWLEVHEKNEAAQNLYKKLGFRVSGRRPAYYRDGADAILYSAG